MSPGIYPISQCGVLWKPILLLSLVSTLHYSIDFVFSPNRTPPACLPLLRPIFKASTSYVSNVYKKSTHSLSRSNKSSSGFSSKTYGISASKDSGSMEEDMLPMYETQTYGGKPVRGHEGPITIENEVSFGYETRRQMETRRNALENGRS